MSAGIDYERGNSEEKWETRSVFDKADSGSTACMLGKLKLFNSKDQRSSPFCNSPSVGSSCHAPSAIHHHSSEQFSDRQEERGAVLQRHPDRSSSVDGPSQAVAIGLPDQREAKGRGKDVHGLSSSNIPGPVVSSGFPTTMEDRDRKRPGSSTAPVGRVATSSTSQPRPSALPSSRTSSSGSVSSLSGIGTVGTPVASSSAAKSSSKSAAKAHTAAGTRNSAPRQGTATALAPPSSSSSSSVAAPVTVMQQGKSGASSGRTRSTKTSSAVGANQPVGRSPSSVGLCQSIDRSPSSHGISQQQSGGVAPSTGKMTALKQTDGGKSRSCENDDLNKCRSAGSSGSRTGLNSILAGPSGSGGMIRSSSRSALQPPQAGRRGDGMTAADQKRSAAATSSSSSSMQEPEFCGDPSRRMSSPDPKLSKSSQKFDISAPIRQGPGVTSNLRSPLAVNPQTVGSGGRAKDVATPDSGLSSSLSTFKTSSSPSAHLPSVTNGAARDSGPQVKPRKIDSDTQTTASIMHVRRQATGSGGQQLPSATQYPGYYRQLSSPQGGGGVGLQSAMPKGRGERLLSGTDAFPKDQSNSSLNSDSTTASGLGDESSKSGSGASNSNNSASSTDSVIYRPPGSCDEGTAEGAAKAVDASRRETTTKPNAPGESSSKGRPPATQFTDHISSLRNKRNNEETQRLQQMCGGGSKTPRATAAGTRNEDCGGGGDRDDGSGAGEEMTSFDVGIKPMQPIVRSSPYAYLRSLPVSLDRPASGAHHHHHPASPSSSIATAAGSGRLHRPLLDPSNMYLSPGRNVGGCLMMGSGRYLPRISADAPSDTEGFDVTAGYMSDGDILRSSYLDDVNSGYMSEGGLTQYVKRIQQRFREGMLAVKECMEKSNLGDDDR